jgi:hypothetical protein
VIRFIQGLPRLLREHYTVSVARADGGLVRAIRAPRTSYYADPFLLRHAERTHLLVEEFRYGENRGRIVTMELDASLAPGPVQELTLPSGHVSFPNVFEHRGQLYMVPETCDRRCVDLYAFDRFPGPPRQVRTLLSGLDAADTVVFPFEGRHWLMTSVREHASWNRCLAIYWLDDLERGALHPHPSNALKLYGERPHSWGRCAGPVLREDERLLRPIHTSVNYYGECMDWMRIGQLTPESFSEAPEPSPPARLAFSRQRNLHHLSTADGLVAYDHRDRSGYLQGLRSLLSGR